MLILQELFLQNRVDLIFFGCIIVVIVMVNLGEQEGILKKETWEIMLRLK